MAAADFNGDHITDLALANTRANNVGIYVGGAGSAVPKTPTRVVATGAQLPKDDVVRHQAVVADDVNGDGKTDLIVVNGTAGVLSVLLGRGDGTFLAAILIDTLPVPTGVAVGDFNGDGRADLAVTSQGTNKVALLLGTGDGHFAEAGEFPAGTQPTSIVAGEFGTSPDDPTHDGKLDLAVTATGEGQVAILFGDGTGRFIGPAKFDAAGATAITAADFNRDGALDLATCNSSNNTVGMILGYDKTGFGSFANPIETVNFGSSVRPTGLAAVDLDHDGNLDLVVAVQSADAKTSGVALLLSRPRPRMRLVYFDPPVLCATGGVPGAVVAGDFDDQTDALDVAIADQNASHVSLLFGNGKGGFGNCATPQALGESLSAPQTRQTAANRHAGAAAHD